MCLLEQADPGDLPPLLMAEQLFFNPFRRHPGSGHHHERRTGPAGPLVQQPGGNFLPRTRGPGDQHPATGGGNPLDRRADVVDHGR